MLLLLLMLQLLLQLLLLALKLLQLLRGCLQCDALRLGLQQNRGLWVRCRLKQEKVLELLLQILLLLLQSELDGLKVCCGDAAEREGRHHRVVTLLDEGLSV